MENRAAEYALNGTVVRRRLNSAYLRQEMVYQLSLCQVLVSISAPHDHAAEGNALEEQQRQSHQNNKDE